MTYEDPVTAFVGPRGHSVLPGGFGRSTLASVGADSPFVSHGSDFRVWDERGRELIDLNNNFTSLVHGHAHPDVTRAAVSALERGASFGMRHRGELRHASALIERLPDLDQVRYTNSGTEAVMLAIRAARAHTGRDRCLFVHSTYHGTSDTALMSGGERSQRGVPAAVAADVVLTAINDTAGLLEVVEAAPESFAAIVLDLLPNRAGLIPVDPGFAATVETLCRRWGIVFVLDEVVTFRLGTGGLGVLHGLKPDVVTLGKLIGGGMPVGAVAGRAAVMDELNPLRPDGLEHGGTFTANPVTIASGQVTLELFDAVAIDRLNALGDRAREQLAERIAGVEWEVRGQGSLFRAFPSAVSREETVQLQRAAWWAAYDAGVLLSQNTLAAVSTPMTRAVVDEAVDRLADAIVQVAERTDPVEAA